MAKNTKKKEKIVPEPRLTEIPAGSIGNIGRYKPVPRFGGCRNC